MHATAVRYHESYRETFVDFRVSSAAEASTVALPPMSMAEWRQLYHLSRDRLSSEDSYRRFQQFQGELLVRYLRSRHIEIAGSRVADVGCGLGGYTQALRAAGGRVVALDLFLGDWSHQLVDGSSALLADALQIPLHDDTFDVVICASLIEHVQHPDLLLSELGRVVRPGGIVYVSFPPFYSPKGGHQFSPFHYLGERNAVRLRRCFGYLRESEWVRKTYPVSPDSFGAAWGAWGLYRMTIGKFERLLLCTSFRKRERSTRLWPLDFSGIPFVRELLTWHVQYLLEKPVHL